MQQLNWSSISQWIFPIAILVIFVVLIIVPQRKRDKKIKDMLSNIKVGDNIKTIGGIYGKVLSIKEDLVTVESGQSTLIFAKGAIATVESADVEADELSTK